MTTNSERGAAAVEFAILLPLLLMLILGVVEFGRAYNVQLTLTAAAREGVRVMAITNDQTKAKDAARAAAASVGSIPAADITISPANCKSPSASPSPSPSPSPSSSPTSSGTSAQVTLTVPYKLASLTGIAGPFALSGKGVMLCGG